jgi:hypothetical protein
MSDATRKARDLSKGQEDYYARFKNPEIERLSLRREIPQISRRMQTTNYITKEGALAYFFRVQHIPFLPPRGFTAGGRQLLLGDGSRSVLSDARGSWRSYLVLHGEGISTRGKYDDE